jgi:hypothetical protein
VTDVRILAEVSADVADAANWYDREGYPGLGDRFEATFYSWVGHLKDKETQHKYFLVRAELTVYSHRLCHEPFSFPFS